MPGTLFEKICLLTLKLGLYRHYPYHIRIQRPCKPRNKLILVCIPLYLGLACCHNTRHKTSLLCCIINSLLIFLAATCLIDIFSPEMEPLSRGESITGEHNRVSNLSASWPGRVLLERLPQVYRPPVGFREPPANDLEIPREPSARGRVDQHSGSGRPRPGSLFRIHPLDSSPPTQFLLCSDINASNPSARSLVAGAFPCFHTFVTLDPLPAIPVVRICTVRSTSIHAHLAC